MSHGVCECVCHGECVCVCVCVWVSVFVCKCVSTAYTVMIILRLQTVCVSAQGWTNHTLAVHERVDSRFLVLPGSESTITEITEYIYFSPLKPSVNLNIKVNNTVPVDLIIEHILFL